MTKKNIEQMPEYFDRYINLVDDIDLIKAFENSIVQLQNIDIDNWNKLENKTYEKDKWTIKEIVKHLSDWERIFCYRTLLFARNEEAYPQGFDEDFLASQSKANVENLLDLINELILIRQSTIALFKSFDSDDFAKIIITYKHKISVLAMGYNLIGHQIHHIRIIEKLYLPLL